MALIITDTLDLLGWLSSNSTGDLVFYQSVPINPFATLVYSSP